MTAMHIGRCVTLASSLVIAGCGEDSPAGESTGAATGTGAGTSSEGSADTTGGATSSGSASASASASAGTTGEPAGDCDPGDIVLESVMLEVETQRIQGGDLATPYEADLGSRACVSGSNELVRLILDYGPFEFDGLQSRLVLEIGDGARTYDLATDAGVPLMDMPGSIRISYSYDNESASTISYDTRNHAATGTIEVTALPDGAGTPFVFTAQGQVGDADGWVFDLSFSALVAP